MSALAGLAALGAFLAFRDGRSWFDLFCALGAFAAFLFFLWTLGSGIRDSTVARIVPCFQRPLGLGTASPFSRGAALARHCEELDKLASEMSVAPISAFGFGENEWHSAASGLDTITKLETRVDDNEVLQDLAAIEAALRRAVEQDVPFFFVLRSGFDRFISPVEMDRRKGSFW